MDQLTKKTLDVKRGHTYTYYTSPARDGKQTVFLAHGWPDSAHLWDDFVTNYLVPEGYGVVAIDCLGYAGTSKPSDPKEYSLKSMSDDVIDILDAENIDKVISLGHDWGCGLSQRLYHFHANRVSGIVMVNVAYMPPVAGEHFDLYETIKTTEKLFGYGSYWYWELFTAPDGVDILNNHVESIFDVAHGKPESWLETLCKPDGVKNFLLADKTQETEAYATTEMKDKFIARMKRDGFEGPQCWYKSMVFGVQDEANMAVPKENLVCNVPALFFGGTRDMVCRPEILGMSVDAGLLPHLKTVTVDCGHWSMLVKPTEFGEAVVGWLKENF